MNEPALVARPCSCSQPLLNGDSCLRCGRRVTAADAPGPRRAGHRRQQEWTRPGVVRALRAFAFFRGRPPMRADWNRSMGRDWPSIETVERLFGSLPDALESAELR
jgi:hypothetical protein